ncbi:MAG: prepilin peptidase [Oscillospiraceae bacterium]|nr:prepilin peptidase [Oscillospiraceae bacterium]
MSIYISTGITIYFSVLAFLFGTVMGSFLNCMAYRIAHGQDWTKGRSHCPDCGHPLGFLDLFPIFSWLFLGGKCRYCGKKISPRYPLTELFFGLVTLACLLRFDLTVLCLRNFIFICCLFTLSLVDLESYIIPNGCLVVAAVAWAVTEPFLFEGWPDLGLHIFAAVLYGGGIMAVSLIMDRVLKKESLGGGDVKLFAVVGLYFGLIGGLFAMIIACVLGLVISLAARRNKIPFGPAIAAACLVMVFFGQGLVSWYTGLF